MIMNPPMVFFFKLNVTFGQKMKPRTKLKFILIYREWEVPTVWPTEYAKTVIFNIET